MGLREPELRSGWYLSLYPQVGEGGGSFRYSQPCRPAGASGPGALGDRGGPAGADEGPPVLRGKPAQPARDADLPRAGCHDPKELRAHVGGFFRSLRADLGGKPLPYLWTAEWHKTGHGLHVHFAVGRYVRRDLIERAWGCGFVHIKLLGDLPVGSTSLDDARQAARYVSKYVGKAFDQRRVPGLHRYEVAQGFQPERVRLYGRTADEALAVACRQMGAEPTLQWSSAEALDWKGPPAVWASWAA